MEIKQPPQYLIIQKVVKLLSEEHLEFFRNYLVSIRAKLPLKLVNSIKPGFHDPQDIDELCNLVYGKNDFLTKRNFNQLASHTFKLTSFLSMNFPSYLSHNVSKVELMLANGKLTDANLLAEALYDMAERIGDYQTLARILKFFIQQSRIRKTVAETFRYHEKLNQILNYELLINELYVYLRKNVDIDVKDISILKSLELHLEYFRQYHSHESNTIRLLSKYSYIYLIYYHRAAGVKIDNYLAELDLFFDDLVKNSVTVFPVLEDLFSKASFMKLNNSSIDINSKEARSEFNRLEVHTRNMLFWQNYNNPSELYVLTIKSTYYISHYHSFLYRKNFRNTLPKQEKAEIKYLCSRCEDLLKKDTWKNNYSNEYIYLRITYAALLMLGDSAAVSKATNDLEELMTTFQQSAFSSSIDSIFICLMIGYFALGDYIQCDVTFNRYIKLARGRVINAENDIEIHTYYYVSQWLLTKRPQYLSKISKNYSIASQHTNHATLEESIRKIVHYFEIPVQLGGIEKDN
jgi:hypothetical protein